MQVSGLINNNYVVAIESSGEEVIVKGTGIGFGARKGSYISDSRIEKIYKINDGHIITELKNLIKNIPEDRFSTCSEIVDYAKKKLGIGLNPNLYVTLTDHINYALVRYSKGIKLDNPMIEDIRGFYPKEFQIGQYAVDLINKRHHAHFNEDEAGFIALHFVNAEANTAMNTTIKSTKLVRGALEIIEAFFNVTMDNDTVSYRRLVTHLQLIANNVFRNKCSISKPDAFNTTVSTSFPAEYECSMKIAKYIKENYGHDLDDDELAYLTVNISRVRTREAE